MTEIANKSTPYKKMMKPKINQTRKSTNTQAKKSTKSNPTNIIPFTNKDNEDKHKKSRLDFSTLHEILHEHYSKRLGIDVCSSKIRLDNQLLDFADIRYQIEKERNIIGSKDDLFNLVYKIAKANPYNPIAEYLDTTYEKYSQQACEDILVNIAKNILGLQSNIEVMYVVKFFVSAVARAKETGCKVDTALVLQGGQGIGKTTFFQALGGDFFYTLSHSTRDNQALKEQYKYWLIEWGEFGAKLTTNKIESLKNEMSKTKDEIKHLYVNESETRSRHFVFVGTTNQEQFLVDPTGNRRFWVIKVDKKIDTDFIKENRDLIWASAMKLYQEGYLWYLTDHEQTLSSQINSNYAIGDVWEPQVLSWVESQIKPFTIADVLTKTLGVTPSRQNKSFSNRVAAILKSAGYQSKRIRTKEFPEGYYWSKI